ncbi:MAG: iron ABC transporter permease [Pseudomonadota bacterium]
MTTTETALTPLPPENEDRSAKRASVVASGNGTRMALVLSAIVVALLLAAPILFVAFSVFQPSSGAWQQLAGTVLPRFIGNTLLLTVLVGIGVFLIGTSTAWLVTMCRFPGRWFFEWALILPLAVPAYVMAYAYTDFLHHPGPVQTLLRDVTGWGPRDYWFPNIRSLEGAALMFTLVLYPYVYLLARTAFLHHSVCAFEVSRTLGMSAFAAFRRVALPMARPAIVTGIALALMETLADFGTVAHFSVQTFTTGIYQTWFSMGDRIAAGQLSASLLVFVLLLIALERWQRGSRKFAPSERRVSDLPEFKLKGWRGVAAFLICGLPVLLGFLLPVIILSGLAIEADKEGVTSRYIHFALNSVTLSGVTAVLAVVLAVLMAYASRIAPSRWTQAANQIASMGYAIPGSIIAVGVLYPLAHFDNAVDRFMEAQFGISTGLLLTGTITALVFAYLVRFMAVALNTVDSSLGKITHSMDDAARSLGHTPMGAVRHVHIPMMWGGLLTAGLIVFVDVMKELPATLIMRPFNFDTLAVQAYRLASDERLAQAAIPSLSIVVVGILPVIVISRQIMRSRPGSSTK